MIKTYSKIITLLLITNTCFAGNPSSSNAVADSTKLDLRRSAVSYHMSFDNRDFFDEDFIEQSGKKSVKERQIDFPQGKFGKGIRMSFIPAPPDENNMSGIDLDLITAVIFNTNPGNTMGYNQPFIWGSGRINPRLGAVAFWAKGKLPFAGPLFEQSSIAFGRKERDLIGITVDGDHKLSAYVRDARYVLHEIKSDKIFDDSGWNHIVLNWDWANGLELWLNGEKIATSWGTDGWYETALPGLFHMPAPGLIYDELYMLDRPMAQKEIRNLMSSNLPPKAESQVYSRKSFDSKRIADYSGADKGMNLPTITPDKPLSFTEVWPTDVADGHVQGLYMIDGRNEMAWPHDYSFFTIIPGDGDFHAEKADIKTSPKSIVNYIALTGNLTNVKVQAGPEGTNNKENLFKVPQGNQFFYGSMISDHEGFTFRIPFTEKYGTPKDFSGDLNLPLSGEKRIHNVGLYHVSSLKDNETLGDKLIISNLETALDKRTQFAAHALTSRDERKFAVASTSNLVGVKNIIDIGAFSRLNILSEPYNQTKGITGITLSIPIKTLNSEEVLYIRIRDPAVPSRLWNQFAVKLSGFSGEYKKLSLRIDFQDIVVTGGDRLWVDLGTAEKTEILLGDKNNPADIFVSAIESYRSVDEYAAKELVSAKAQYSKQYEFMPWQFTGRTVDIEKPYCFGGPFDMLLPALAVKRVKDDNFVANYQIKVSGPGFKDGHRIDKKNVSLITLPVEHGAPEWAVYMRDYNKKRWAMADWWSERQNDDGQVGGGWNDDTLFGSMGLEDVALDGHEKLQDLINNVHTKFEKTRLFKDGFCNIYPIDRMHTGDFISERYKTLVGNLGQVHAVEREMESAWRLGKPDQTPVNYYADGFKSAFNVLNWYWGKDVPEEPYISKPLEELTKEFRLFTSVFDDDYFYRMTASNVMRDDFVPFGSGAWSGQNNMYSYMLGGERGTRVDAHVRLAVMWPSGGGPDMARVILHADDNSLDAALYSFDSELRNLEMRLCRINNGLYKIGLYESIGNSGNAGAPVWATEKNLTRFDIITLPVPPRKSLVLKVEQIHKTDRPTELPDLALDTDETVFKNGNISTTVHNLGNGRAENIMVRLLDGEKVLQEKVIRFLDAPIDFVAKRIEIVFSNVPVSRNLKIIIDPEKQINEILLENNLVKVKYN